MPIEKFQITFTESETPTMLLPPDTGLSTISTVIEWLSKLPFQIIMGFPLKRKKLKKHLIAKSVLQYSATSPDLPEIFRPTTSWASYTLGILQSQTPEQ